MKESRAIHRIGFPWDNKIFVGIPRVGLAGYHTEPYGRNPDEVILNPLYLKPALSESSSSILQVSELYSLGFSTRK